MNTTLAGTHHELAHVCGDGVVVSYYGGDVIPGGGDELGVESGGHRQRMRNEWRERVRGMRHVQDTVQGK